MSTSLNDRIRAWVASPETKLPPDLRRDLAQARLANLGEDGRCLCSCADICPAQKSGMSTRCSRAELENLT